MSSTSPTIQPPSCQDIPSEDLVQETDLDTGHVGSDHVAENRTRSQEQKNERRSAFPGMERHRRLFGKIEQIVRRYSIDPLATNDQGKYAVDIETVKRFLEQEVRELSNLDALIPLLRILKDKEWNLNDGDKRIGAYRLVSPNIKELNDHYLGPNQTDDYVEELHHKIEEILGQNSARVLKSHFKGGIFIIDVARIEHDEPNGRSNIDVLEGKLGEIQKVARDVLIGHLKKRRFHLQRKQAQKSMERLELSQEEELIGAERDATDLREESLRTLSKEIHKLEENIEELEAMIAKIESGEKSIDIAIGLDKLKPGPQNNYLSIRNAECAANIATLQKLDPEILNGNGKRNGIPFVYMREYSHKELFKHLIKAQRLLSEVIEVDEEGNVSVKEDWRAFFYIHSNPDDEDDTMNGYVRMNPDMINTYRHVDKYRKSDDYLSMSEEQRSAFEEKIKFFERYYKAINIVDFLKNFQTENIDTYLSDIYAIVGLVTTAEKLLKEKESDEYRLRRMLDRTTKALEVSLKNDSPIEKRVKTTRAAIKAMMEPGMKIVIFGDNIGFGALNQAAFEQNAIELIKMLEISNEEWQAIVQENGSIDKAGLDALLQKKLDDIHENPQFATKMMSFDDAGTAYLRGIEEKMYRMYGGNPVIDADGGDETRAVFTGNNVPELVQKAQDAHADLKTFSTSNNIRIAARVDDFQLPPITTAEIQKEQREAILELIATMEDAEEAHAEIKALNMRKLHRIVLLRQKSEN